MTSAPVDSTQLTRQQLEELDALLQRMLALTQRSVASNINCGDSVSHGLVSTDSSPPAVQALAPSQVNVPAESAQHIGKTDSQISSAQQLTSYLSDDNKNILSLASSAKANDLTELPIAEELVEKQSYNNIHYLLYPLVYITCIYNKICRNLGWIGRVLNTCVTRYLLGISGIILLFYTLLWYTQSQGIVRWPISVPWTLQDWYDIISHGLQ
jgi:hypothetical protein